jgi:hypothetical protein
MIRFFFSFSENVSNSTFLIRRKRHSSPLRHVYRFPGSPSTTREMKKNPATLPFQQQQPPPSSFVFSFILFLSLLFRGWRKKRRMRPNIYFDQLCRRAKWIEIASWWRDESENQGTLTDIDAGRIDISFWTFFFLCFLLFFFMERGGKKNLHPSAIGRIQSGSDGSVTL